MKIGFKHGTLAPLSLTKPPTQGTVQIEPVQDRVRVAYRPGVEFMGGDDFELWAQLLRGSSLILIHTTVTL